MPRILKASTISNRFAAIKSAQQSSSPAKQTDTLKAVNDTLGANFGSVPVGEGMAFPTPAGVEPKKHLAAIRGKLVAVAREGQPWAGRKFQTGLDKATNEVLVMRLADGSALPKKVGGRKPGSTNGTTTTANATPAPTPAPAPAPSGRSTGKTQVKDLTSGNATA